MKVPWLRAAKFIAPLGIWALVMRDFISGVIPVNMDTNTIYGVAKFYFNNVLNGVIPLWDPFVALGRPFYALPICNLFHPITQVIPLLKILGFSYQIAFNIYIVLFFFFGCAGFYVLAKRILRDEPLAYAAYVAFIFSSIGVSVFTQFTFLELIVPAIWFFYFVLSFAQEQKKAYFLGMCWTVMTMFTSYLPFYFATVFMVIFLSALILYRAQVMKLLGDMGRFILANRVMAVISVVGICIAAAPLIAYKLVDASGDIVAPGRHCQFSTMQECYDRTMNNKGGMEYVEIARSGGLGERLDIGYLFSHLDKITYGSDSFFFIPFFLFLILSVSIFFKMDRLNILLCVSMLLTGLIALGDSAPLHKILYDHVFFVKYFRNLFFFGAFLIPMAILLSLKQLQVFMALPQQPFAVRKLAAVGVVSMAVILGLYMNHVGGIMPAAWLTLGAGAAALVGYVLGLSRGGTKAWMWIWSLLVVIQPIVIMQAYSANAREFKCALPSEHVRPEFAWVRPTVEPSSSCRIYQFVPYEDFWHAMSMTDATADMKFPQSAARLSFALSKQIGDEALKQYAQYKIYLYSPDYQQGMAMTGPGETLNVAHFDVNRVVFRTKFANPIRLVYNDSYTSLWKAAIDGQKANLEIGNSAFKSVLVPAGEHEVEMTYQPPGGQWVYAVTAIILFAFLIWTLLMLYWRR